MNFRWIERNMIFHIVKNQASSFFMVMILCNFSHICCNKITYIVGKFLHYQLTNFRVILYSLDNKPPPAPESKPPSIVSPQSYTLPNLSPLELEFQVECQTQLGIPIWIQIEIGIPSWIVDHSGECMYNVFLMEKSSIESPFSKVTLNPPGLLSRLHVYSIYSILETQNEILLQYQCMSISKQHDFFLLTNTHTVHPFLGSPKTIIKWSLMVGKTWTEHILCHI